MNEEVQGQLAALEQTEGWDMQQQRGRIAVLNGLVGVMTREEYLRFRSLCDRFQQRIMALMPAA